MPGDWPYRDEIMLVTAAEILTDPCPECGCSRHGPLMVMCTCPLPCGCGRAWLGRQRVSPRFCCLNEYCGVSFQVASPPS